MENHDHYMRVSELAKVADVSPETIRYYARTGLLPTHKQQNGYRFFTDADIRRLRFIRIAQVLGFHLKEIEEIIRLSEKGQSPCSRVRNILQSRIIETAKELDRVTQMYARMQDALEQWRQMPDESSDDHEVCGLIEAIDQTPKEVTFSNEARQCQCAQDTCADQKSTVPSLPRLASAALNP